MFCFFSHCIYLESTVHLILNKKATKEGKTPFMSVATEHGYSFLARRQKLRHTEKILTVNACKYFQLPHLFHKYSFSKNYSHLLSSFGFYITQV